MNRDQISKSVQDAQAEDVAYFGAFDTDAFFQKLGTAWSPAETVRHLIKSIRAVAKALAMPRLVLRLMFGWPRRPSVTYDALRTRYLALLAAGGKAGRFGPSPQTDADMPTIMNRLALANGDLVAAIGRWKERDLDRYQLPHPLLGKLTVREMLFFTVYHQHHHLEVTKRRRAEMGGISSPAHL